MSTTAFGALTDLQRKVWAKKTNKDGRDQSFWMSNSLVGSNTDDHNRPVQKITELSRSADGSGDKVIMNIVHDLQKDGIVGDAQLTGNEEAMNAEAITLNVDLLRHGVKSAGEMNEQRTVIAFRKTAKERLSFWLADSLDEMMFLVASGRALTLNTDGSTRSDTSWSTFTFASDVAAATSNRILHAGSATSEGTLTASDTMSWDLLIAAKTKAVRKRIRPIRAGGKPYYVIVLSPEQCRDLKQDSDYQAAVARGQSRGKGNPLFTGEEVTVDGLVIYEHNKVYNTFGLTSAVDKWGSGQTVDGAQALLMGAQALGFASVGDSFWKEADINDYGNQPGIAYGQIIGLLKPQFQSSVDANATEDYGVISVKTAAAET